MTLKRYTNSHKTNRKIGRMPAEKRQNFMIEASGHKRYLKKRTCKSFKDLNKLLCENIAPDSPFK